MHRQSMKENVGNSHNMSHGMNQSVNEQSDKMKKLMEANVALKRDIEAMKNKKDDVVNEKILEMNELRKQMNEQSMIIIKQREEIKNYKQQQQNVNNNNNNNNKTKDNSQYNDLKKAYDSLRRDHEDLLVYVGHLDEKLKRLQNVKRPKNTQQINHQ